MVPKGWGKVSLGEVFDFRNGINADKSQYGQGIKFVNVMDVFGHDVLTEPKIIGRISISEKKLDDNRLEYGDVLFNRTSETFDEIAMSAVYLDSADATFGGFVIRGRPLTNSLDPKYTVYAFQDSNFRKQVIKLGQGAIRANIGQKDLVKVELLVPPLPEQQKIAKILSTCDKAISTTERLIDNSTQQKKALMQQLLTGKKRLLNDEGKPFEGEWEEVELKDIANIYQPQTISQKHLTNEGYLVYGANGIIGKYSDYNHENEQIAVTCRGSTCGVVNWTEPKSWITGNAMVINVDEFEQVSKRYLYYKLSFTNFSYLISGSGQPQITGNIKNHKAEIPSLKEQQKIATVLTNADKEIELLKQQLADLQQEKKALMQVLLTGKKRVLVDGG